MVYECKPVMCADCGGIGHNAEQCRKKRYEVAQAKIIAKKKWVPKAQQVQQGNVLKPAIQAVDAGQGLAPIAEHPQEEQGEDDPKEKQVDTAEPSSAPGQQTRVRM